MTLSKMDLLVLDQGPLKSVIKGARSLKYCKDVNLGFNWLRTMHLMLRRLNKVVNRLEFSFFPKKKYIKGFNNLEDVSILAEDKKTWKRATYLPKIKSLSIGNPNPHGGVF